MQETQTQHYTNTLGASTTPFSGPSRKLNEDHNNENDRLRIKGIISGEGKGKIRESRLRSVGLEEKMTNIASTILRTRKTLIIEKISIKYDPLVSEYLADWIELTMSMEGTNKNPSSNTPLLKVLFRCSDRVLIEINTSWALCNINGNITGQLSVEYRTGKISNIKALGEIRISCQGYLKSGSPSKAKRESSNAFIGKKVVDPGLFAFDFSMVKFYFPGGGYNAEDPLSDIKHNSILQMIKSNNIEISRDVLFNMLSSLPAVFRDEVLKITPYNYNSVALNPKLVEHFRRFKSQEVKISIPYEIYVEFFMGNAEKHVSYFGTQI